MPKNEGCAYFYSRNYSYMEFTVALVILMLQSVRLWYCFQILSLLCIISVSVPKNEGCAYLYSGSYSYMEFTSSSCLISCIIWYGLYVLAVTKKIGFVRWDITVIIKLSLSFRHFMFSKINLKFTFPMDTSSVKLCEVGVDLDTPFIPSK